MLPERDNFRPLVGALGLVFLVWFLFMVLAAYFMHERLAACERVLTVRQSLIVGRWTL